MTSNWKHYKFSELCDITRGGSPRPIHDWIAPEGIPWVKIADATASGSRFITQTKEFIKEDGKYNSREVYPGDLILSNSATPGLPKIMGIYACIHDGWLLLRNFRNIDKNFCYYLLQTQRQKLLMQGNGSVFTNLKTDILKNHIVSIPPLHEQERIADILGSLDDKIELNRQMNQTLESMARAIFKSWFVDFDPVYAKKEGRDYPLPPEIMDLFPDELEESELGLIPKGWKVGKVGEEFRITMGQSPPGSSYNEEGIGVPFFQGRRDFGFRFPTQRVYCTEPKRFAEKNDTLVSVRAPVGDVNMAMEECCIGRGVAAIQHHSGSASYTYYSMLRLKEVFNKFEAEGTVFGSISKTDFKNLKFLIPELTLLNLFEKHVSYYDKRIELNSEISTSLLQLRTAMMNKIFSQNETSFIYISKNLNREN